MVKNRSTPENNAFWDHVESIAAQVRERRGSSAMGIEIPNPYDLAAVHSAAKKISDSSQHIIQQQAERIANLEQALREKDKDVEAYAQLKDQLAAELSRLRSQIESMGKPVTDKEGV